MKKTKKRIPGVVALSLVVAMVMVMVSGIASAAGVSVLTATPAGQSIHGKINMSDITGEIAEPPQLTSAASAVAKEKAWYEYIYYSPEPVGYYYYNDVTRLTFYDPYDYADALVMSVNDNITDWSSMNSLQVSYTTGDSLSVTDGASTQSESSVQIAAGADISDTYTDESVVTSTTLGAVETYNLSKGGSKSDTSDGNISTEVDGSWSVQTTVLGELETKTGVYIADVTTKTGVNVTTTNNFGAKVTASEGYSTTVEEHYDEDIGYSIDTSSSITKSDASHSRVVSTIADRVTRATGATVSSDISISTDNSTTITKTYDAAYFNASGSPLQWKIIQYTVKMPMKIQVEYLVDGEWIYDDYNYCLLNTIQGTCRAWLQNSVAYYEHWGDGSPVTWNEFWSQFFTEESLTQAYQNRLYPEY